MPLHTVEKILLATSTLLKVPAQVPVLRVQVPVPE